MKHVIFGESAARLLKSALKKESAQIIALPNYLGEGPIQGLLTNEGLHQRACWLGSRFRLMACNGYSVLNGQLSSWS